MRTSFLPANASRAVVSARSGGGVLLAQVAQDESVEFGAGEARHRGLLGPDR
ncbi:MAG: hypothetical protein ACNA8W_25055 [Bradymonadaceae bacterium]